MRTINDQERRRRRHRRRIQIVVIYTAIAIGLAWFFESQATTTIIFVRHAEKAGPSASDPGLSDAGRRRAEELTRQLVDADVVKPHISREFGLAKRLGLIDLLVDDSQQVSDCLVRTDLNDIQILPAGQKHAQSTELLASERMSEIITELSSRYSDRIILMDSPPLLAASEAPAVADQVGQIVLVVESGETTHQALMETINILNPEKAINIILNKSRHSMLSGHYGGGYGYYGY